VYWFMADRATLSFAGDGSRRVKQGSDIVTEVYRQRDLPPAANCGRVVGVMTSVVLAQAALGPADASTWAA
jgi:hypothetical protein